MVIGSFRCWPVTSVTRTDGDSFFMWSRGRLRRDRNRRFEYSCESTSDSGLGCQPMRDRGDQSANCKRTLGETTRDERETIMTLWFRKEQEGRSNN